MVDPRTPVLVGAGQATQRAEDPVQAREPIDLLADAARAADADAGATRSVLAAVDTIAVVDIVSWKYPDPGALLGRRLDVDPRTTMTTTVGGNSPQLLVNELALAVARGDVRAALVGGAECVYTRWRARREPKTWLDWTQADDPPCTNVVGDPRAGTNDYEMAHTAIAPTQIYPLFETALRADAGRTVDEHQREVSELWAGFAAVAAENPYAWSRVAFSPEDIRTPARDNRVVTFPYLKRMCANIDVDQAAALLLCSYEIARDHGVPDDRLVFPLAGADAHDHFFFSERETLSASPAIAAAGRAALDSAGFGIDDVARFDLYSCFPSAVEIALGALGLRGPDGGDTRPLTVTGGLGFAGGPANNYPTHAIAAMVDACRRDPGSVGMVSALGWYATKHSIGIYSTAPPARGFVRADAAITQAGVDRLPGRETAGAYSGPATVEATAVVFEREGAPSVAIVSSLTPDGRRALANTRDTPAMRDMTEKAWEGRRVTLRTDGTVNTLDV
ncbi:MAG TPA: acetyl-CoA acetyltransferase [Acidimicrobiia bacterium]|nr:acetyl-CoA acetyltransferase [Acidimicrobiia bacterium]